MIDQITKSGYLRRDPITRTVIAVPDLPRDLVELLWRDPKTLFHHGETLRRTSMRRTVRVTWGAKQYVLKHYRPTYWHFVRQLPLRSWASATFMVTNRLIRAGIATPRPVACIENRWAALRRDSFLMYEYVEGVTLGSYLREKATHRRPLAENISRQIRDFWSRIEEMRIGLADAHTGNFIICTRGYLWLIDLDKTRFHRSSTAAARNHQRGMQKFVRSADKCGPHNVAHVLTNYAA